MDVTWGNAPHNGRCTRCWWDIGVGEPICVLPRYPTLDIPEALMADVEVAAAVTDWRHQDCRNSPGIQAAHPAMAGRPAPR